MRQGMLRHGFYFGVAILTVICAFGCTNSESDSTDLTSSHSASTAPATQVFITDSLQSQLTSTNSTDRSTAQATIRQALYGIDEKTRIEAIRLAMHPASGMIAEVAGLLTDPVVEVRRAAILALGPVLASETDPGPEIFFGSLHDSDAEIRDLAVSALKSRGLSAAQIELARKLVSPKVRDRLQLLVDLSYEDGLVGDLGAWLERLSRDPDPAVRLGAARIVVERQIPTHSWLDRLAETDPDATVRQVANWYRDHARPIRPAAFAEPMR